MIVRLEKNAASFWNNLETSLKFSHSVQVFKRLVKSTVINNNLSIVNSTKPSVVIS